MTMIFDSKFNISKKVMERGRKLKGFEEGSVEEFCAFVEDYWDFLVLETSYEDDYETRIAVFSSRCYRVFSRRTTAGMSIC